MKFVCTVMTASYDDHSTTSGRHPPRPCRPNHACVPTVFDSNPQIRMPPPKKPKNGPTSLEQFMSKEELQILGKNKRPVRKESNVASRSNRSPAESPSHRLPEVLSVRETGHKYLPVGGSVSSYDDGCEPGSPRSASRQSSMERHDSVSAESESERLFKNVRHNVSPARDFPGDPPRLVRGSCLTPSIQDAEIASHSTFAQPLTGSTEGSILERLFTSRSTERVILDSGSSFHDRPSWSHGLSSAPLGQPPVFSHDPRHAGLSHRLTTSNTLASLMTRPAWIPFEHCRPMGSAPGQSSLHLNIPSNSGSSSIDIQGLKPATSFASVQQQQQQQQQHQQQQQNMDGRSILASLSGNQMSSGSTDHSPPHSEEVYLLKTSPPSRADASSYLNSLMRQPLTQHMSEAMGAPTSRLISTTHRTESTIYLHPAFQLPPATTSSFRTNNSTSSLCLISNPPLGNSCLPGLPRLSNAKTFPPPTSPMKQSQGQTQISLCGSGLSNLSSSAGSINSSISMISNSNSNPRDDIRLLDLSLKNRHSDSLTMPSREIKLATPPRESSMLTAKMEVSQLETDHKSPRFISSVVPAESDDSNGYINVTSPVPTSSLLRAIAETRGSTLTVMEKPQVLASTKLAGLLTTSSGVLLPTQGPGSLTVKDEAGSTTVSYVLLPCKTEVHRHGSSTESREPSDSKSPKEEERMVSPSLSSCMQVLPLGGSGESSGGSAHLQAATSTTPEAGSDLHHHNFLLDVRATGIGASPTAHMKQEVGGTMPGSSIQSRLCQVCNDNASGFHYGVWSCEGCKAFFKRSIQGPVDYICPATNTCTIDKHRRKSCQACRLRRCYEVGMNKGSQRKERKSSGTTTALKGKRCRADSSESAINSTINGTPTLKAAKRSRSVSILEALQKADLPVLESYHNHSLPATRVHLLNTLIKLADRELVYLINWAKHVPDYTCLTLSDQVHLIECCWMELLLLNCAFRSMEYEGRTLVFAPDFHLERQQWAVTGMSDVLEQVSAVSEQMVLHGLTKEELLLLQATVLVNAEVRHMDSFVKIQDMRQVILDVFMEVAGRHQGYGNLRHAPSILLLLTHVRQAGERGITFFQRLKTEGCVSFCDLFTEMLDAHNSSGERQRLQQQQQQHHHQQRPSQTLLQQQQHQPTHHQHAQQQQHPQHSMAPE